RVVEERRRDEDLGAGGPPAIEQMGIEKGEGAVPGDRDTLSRWRMFLRRTGGEHRRAGVTSDGIEIDAGLDAVGKQIKKPADIGRLRRLHQTEVTRRQTHAL